MQNRLRAIGPQQILQVLAEVPVLLIAELAVHGNGTLFGQQCFQLGRRDGRKCPQGAFPRTTAMKLYLGGREQPYWFLVVQPIKQLLGL